MALWDNWIKNKLQVQIDELMKSDDRDADALPDKKQPEQSDFIAGKAVISDPFYEQMSQERRRGYFGRR